MKLTMTKVLTPIAALAFSFGVQAAAVSTETFDTYTAGTTVITNQTGWSFTYGTDGADDASAITAYDNNAPSVGPDGVSAGANYLKLSTEDGILFRNMKDTGGTVPLNNGLFVDTDVQFTITDASDRPTPTAEDKFIIWLEAGVDANDVPYTNLCAYALNLADGVVTSNAYTLVDASGNSLGIEPGSWHRLTVKAISDANAGGNSALPGFQVYLDGVVVKTSAIVATGTSYSGLSSSAQGLVDAQTFLPAMASSMTSLSQVGFSGEGAIDSVVVTHEVPGFENPATLTFTLPAEIASVSIPDLGLTGITNGAAVRVVPGTYSLAFTPASGTVEELFNNYAITIGGVECAAAGAASITVATTATIAINATAKDTVNVTFNWSDLNNAMGERATENTAITFTVGDGEPQAADLNEETMTLSGLKVGTNITVTVTYSTADWATTITPDSCMSLSGTTLTINSRPSSGVATVSISAMLPVAKIGDTPYATFADALAAATTAGSATIKLASAATVGDAAIAADKDITIDLNGQTITGAAEAAAVFAVAADGTLTVTNSAVADGYVIAGSAAACISNAGTLNLQAGKFNGTISGGTINVTGGAYTADIAGAVCPAGYSLQQNAGAGDAYVYQLAAVSYTIAYYYDATLLDLAPATYTYGAGATLPQSAGEVTGKTFVGWYDNAQLTGDAVTAIATTDTGNKTFYAKYDTATVTVTFNANNNEATGTMAAQSIDYNTATALTANGFALSGHTFSGWATASDGEVVYADQASVTLTADITLYAVWTSSGSVYPTYLQDADQTVKAQYDNWKQTYGADTQSAYEAAFLLNVDPNSGDTTLDTSAVTINGTTVTLTTGHTSFNGYVYVKAASTLAGLDSATPTFVTPVNGVITLTGQSGTAAFYKIIVSATEISE